MEIKDKTIKLCVCGKNRKKLVLDGKSRALGWMAAAAILLIASVIIFDIGIFLQDISDTIEHGDIKSIVAYGVISYLSVSVVIRLIIYRLKCKHSLRCSLRMAWIKTVY